MGKAEYVRMRVEGLTLDPTTKAPIIVLRDEDGEMALPIWVGLLEATSLATELEGVKLARPMTHDLLKTLIEEFQATVDRIEVTSIQDNTFYALIHLVAGDRTVAIDARPSDAISLALRTGSPIYVARQVLADAAGSATDGEGDEEGDQDTIQDLSDVSREEWSEILDKLDPADFKYKM
jgi:bifunctional DNase/RNase